MRTIPLTRLLDNHSKQKTPYYTLIHFLSQNPYYNMIKLSNSFAVTGLCLLLLSCGSQTPKPSPSDFVDGVSTALENGGEVDLTAFQWTREPAAFSIDGQTLTVTTAPHTDLWQRTYYHFRNDNAPVLQMKTREHYFSFVVKTDFTQSHQRFDPVRRGDVSGQRQLAQGLCGV